MSSLHELLEVTVPLCQMKNSRTKVKVNPAYNIKIALPPLSEEREHCKLSYKCLEYIHQKIKDNNIKMNKRGKRRFQIFKPKATTVQNEILDSMPHFGIVYKEYLHTFRSNLNRTLQSSP